LKLNTNLAKKPVQKRKENNSLFMKIWQFIAKGTAFDPEVYK